MRASLTRYQAAGIAERAICTSRHVKAGGGGVRLLDAMRVESRADSQLAKCKPVGSHAAPSSRRPHVAHGAIGKSAWRAQLGACLRSELPAQRLAGQQQAGQQLSGWSGLGRGSWWLPRAAVRERCLLRQAAARVVREQCGWVRDSFRLQLTSVH